MFSEVVRRCAFCGIERSVSAQSHAQNQFCNSCLGERIAITRAELGVFQTTVNRRQSEISSQIETVSPSALTRRAD